MIRYITYAGLILVWIALYFSKVSDRENVLVIFGGIVLWFIGITSILEAVDVGYDPKQNE